MENYIKEGKNGFAIHRIPTQSFAANEIDLLLKLLVYNLFERFKLQCCNPIHRSFTIQRFRREFIRCAGVLVRSGRMLKLKMAESFPNRWAWLSMERKSIFLERTVIPKLVLEIPVAPSCGEGQRGFIAVFAFKMNFIYFVIPKLVIIPITCRRQ